MVPNSNNGSGGTGTDSRPLGGPVTATVLTAAIGHLTLLSNNLLEERDEFSR